MYGNERNQIERMAEHLGGDSKRGDFEEERIALVYAVTVVRDALGELNEHSSSLLGVPDSAELYDDLCEWIEKAGGTK